MIYKIKEDSYSLLSFNSLDIIKPTLYLLFLPDDTQTYECDTVVFSNGVCFIDIFYHMVK